MWAAQQARRLHPKVLRAEKAKREQVVSTRTEYHPEFHGFSIKVAAVQPVSDLYGLMLGDVLHNFRSCLDNAAWAVVLRGCESGAILADTRSAEVRRRKVQFPCAPKDRFAVSMRDHVPGASRADTAVIRWAQGYQFAKRWQALHVLSILVEKNNLDKHKTIQPIRAAPVGYVPAKWVAAGCDFRRWKPMPSKSLDVGTELARFYVRKTGPNPTLEVEGDLRLGITIAEDVGLATFLNNTARWSFDILRGFSQCPPEIRDGVANLARPVSGHDWPP